MNRVAPPNDTSAARRNAARALMRTVRELAQGLGSPGTASGSLMASRIAQEARRAATQWPTREAQHRFLVEFAGEVRHEPHQPDTPRGVFLEQIAGLIDEGACAEPPSPART